MGQRGGWSSRVRAGSHGMGFLKFIGREWLRFSSYIRLIQGDSSKISFWEEMWCGNSSLKEMFPGLYSLASNKEASTAYNFDSLSGSC